jgi:hypothetical protein
MIREGVLVVGAGIVAGLIGASWLARTLTGLLHEVTPADPVALISVALLLSGSGIAAAYVPRGEPPASTHWTRSDTNDARAR